LILAILVLALAIPILVLVILIPVLILVFVLLVRSVTDLNGILANLAAR
jgi:hypothetical protein